MPSRVDVVLKKLPDQLAAIEAECERDLTAKQMSDDLLHDIARFIEDCQRVLDWTATDLDHAFGKASDRSPYFPLAPDTSRFASRMAKDFPSVPTDVYDAVERHQPYQPGKSELGLLHDLTRVNKHQDFSAQTRTETRRIRAESPGGGSVEWTPFDPNTGSGVTFGSGVFINGVPVNPVTQRPVPSPTQAVTETIYVGWDFTKPPAPVLPTLHALATLTSAAVLDIRGAAFP